MQKTSHCIAWFYEKKDEGSVMVQHFSDTNARVIAAEAGTGSGHGLNLNSAVEKSLIN